MAFINSIKDAANNKLAEIKNEVFLKKKGYVLNEYRVCNGPKESLYIKAVQNDEEKRLFFLSERIIEANSVLVDQFQNTYLIKKSYHDKNNLLSEGENVVITTISEFDPYIPNNPIRNAFSQQASITQTVGGLSNIQNSGTINLTIEQKATIEQTLNASQLFESVESEATYRFKPVSNLEVVIKLLKDILNGQEVIGRLEDKIIKELVNQATGLLKDALLILIKKIKENVSSNN